MTQNEMPEDLIRYDILTQEALRDVIRKVLEEVSAAGLPDEHHFFITFRTDYPGVRLSPRMLKKYPEEMTIVIQHSYWDLKVNDVYFEIDLSFDDILERLRIPFASLQRFFDPHVKFAVQFDTEYIEAANADIEDDTPQEDTSENLPQIAQTREVTAAEDAELVDPTLQEPEDDEDKPESDQGAEIVSLDKFRKKQ